MRSLSGLLRYLEAELPRLQKMRILAGFDGFIDTIARPVKTTRTGGSEYFRTIEEFGAFIAGHGHKSLSLQYDVLTRKAGGNMPNFVKALDALSLYTIAVGMLGTSAIDPLFADLGRERYSYCTAGTATALEFEDGKVFLSPAGIPPELRQTRAFDRVEAAYPELCRTTTDAELLAFLNWSELSFAEDLWDDLYTHVLCSAGADKCRFVFFDLCDTGAKNPEEIDRILGLIARMGERRAAILSLNKNEALDLYHKCCVKDALHDVGDTPDLAFAAEQLRIKSGAEEVVIHQHSESLAAFKSGTQSGLARESCVLNRQPKISTGAGDHFNAAYCFATLALLGPAEKLRFANAYSGAYIASGISPCLQDLDGGKKEP
ncbi:MAG: hypothetical protein LBD82_08570 [Deltaproteobacteria bacterium]|nr:hypothetical protein [Deltaproteobacteria bacterium]